MIYESLNNASRRVFLGAILLFALPINARAGSVAAGSHIRIVCDFDDEKIAKDALDLGERGWTEAAKLWNRPPPVETPRDVHLFETIAGYEAVEAEITHGRFKPNLAFTSEA